MTDMAELQHSNFIVWFRVAALKWVIIHDKCEKHSHHVKYRSSSMDNFSQESLRFWDSMPPLSRTIQLKMKESKKQKKVRKRSDTIATEEVNIIPRFVTNSCLSSKCLMLSLSVQCFECYDMLMVYWDDSLVQGVLQNFTKRMSFL